MTERPSSGIVTTLNPNDVLCGRGSGPNDYTGNIHFRCYVFERRDEYLSTSNRATKAKIALEIVERVWKSDPPGRFLEKLSKNNYRIIDDDKALEKAKQALRQNREKRHKNHPDDTSVESNMLSIVTPPGMVISKKTDLPIIVGNTQHVPKALPSDTITENGDPMSMKNNSILETFKDKDDQSLLEENGYAMLRNSVGIGRDSFIVDDPPPKKSSEPGKSSLASPGNRMSCFEEDLKSMSASMVSLLNDLDNSDSEPAPKNRARVPSRVRRTQSGPGNSMTSSQNSILRSITLSEMEPLAVSGSLRDSIPTSSMSSVFPYVASLIEGDVDQAQSSSSSRVSMSISLSDCAEDSLRPRTLSEMKNLSDSNESAMSSSTCMDIVAALRTNNVKEGGVVSEDEGI
eukprot:CAMPEP_0172489772 /NCGR_PEP_ID=MMETSP1066-20121228/19990_1 /TAXON_ID=671091 /ORGANISM="Coscinodiscus wailesii, Strain CCMP2513" /LENGTH=401 /DNA_ID=CAMNT_0013257871 /DNA_START=28 /DNA_END=1233 /DNA_ORIENTATION=+